MIRIEEQQLAAGKAVARSYIKQRGVQEPAAQRSIERFLGAYEAVREATGSHDAAVYIASGEARSALHTKPQSGAFRYPESPAALFAHVEHAPAPLAGYFNYLHEAAESRVSRAAVPAAIAVVNRTYTLHKPVREEPLVGLEHEQHDLEKYVRQLFAYDAESMSNAHAGIFPRTILLTGPPGTGKSSLLKHVFATAAKLERLAGLPCTTEVYDASSFSSYFGKSTRILKQKLERVANPGGVGIFCIEDADMVLQSRNDSNAFHGVLELQQHLMNHLSGLEPYYGNTLTLLTTNKPESIDDALRSRVQAVYTVNPFLRLEAHERFLRLHLPQMEGISDVASLTHAAGYAGRELERVVIQARALTTRAPTDEELADRRCAVNACAAIDAALLRSIIASAARTAPRRS